MFQPVEVTIDGGYDIKLPLFVPVKQKFKVAKVSNIDDAIRLELNKEEIKGLIKPEQKIAVAVGSRGIANLKEIVCQTVQYINSCGAHPVIIPAMGSHGGATAEGQRRLLADYGITEGEIGAPVLSSMDTIEIGRTSSGLPIYIDREAFQADGIVVINRVKPHTSFKGAYESGLLKMLVIGLGKHVGASSIHSYGFDQFKELIPQAGRVILETAKVLFGLAVLENAEDETARIEAIPANKIYDREPYLLAEAKSYMAKIIPRSFDVLVVEEIGKEISGTGMDPNIVGRPGLSYAEFAGPKFQKSVILDLTEQTKGNACGVGMADVITRALLNKIDFQYLYANAITSTSLGAAKIPVVMNTEKEALAVALKTCNRVDVSKAKIVFIKNTLELNTILVSGPVLAEIEHDENVEIIGQELKLTFDETGKLLHRPSQY
ncbi:MAG: lactate racemase domain-containing protein [Bacillota bacterium]|nr:lactate racemase domain-containing protein [Bacillota bacterium]